MRNGAEVPGQARATHPHNLQHQQPSKSVHRQTGGVRALGIGSLWSPGFFRINRDYLAVTLRRAGSLLVPGEPLRQASIPSRRRLDPRDRATYLATCGPSAGSPVDHKLCRGNSLCLVAVDKSASRQGKQTRRNLGKASQAREGERAKAPQGE
ncbi:hypothetical protein CSOJ01_09754 [Colletotrichum sojae]|uniref:Uncharacterized protein n=1 Tax=Colletotrichum sojae TaxID=2175907 RepID=A0A8H6J2C5_9PEZI|nr:hypothetical protein CSOJ01_09754 [Colletotrichum sojae]